jgi:hypothetical protein
METTAAKGPPVAAPAALGGEDALRGVSDHRGRARRSGCASNPRRRGGDHLSRIRRAGAPDRRRPRVAWGGARRHGRVDAGQPSGVQRRRHGGAAARGARGSGPDPPHRASRAPRSACRAPAPARPRVSWRSMATSPRGVGATPWPACPSSPTTSRGWCWPPGGSSARASTIRGSTPCCSGSLSRRCRIAARSVHVRLPQTTTSLGRSLALMTAAAAGSR